MDTNDVTTRVLIDIRGDIREIRQRMDNMNTRTDNIDLRMDNIDLRMDNIDVDLKAGFDVLNKRLTETQTRVSTEILGLQGTLNDVQRMLRPLYARFGPRKLPDD